MKPNLRLLLVLVAVALIAMPGMAQKTPSSMVAAYDSLAKIILNVLQAEEDFVRAMLDGHYHGAKALMKQGKYDEAAAEMALFANEGDNAIAGVRKRLLEGGHHHNAAGEADGTFEPGFVIITRAAKKEALAASADMRKATDEAAGKKAWQRFEAVAKPLVATD